MDTIHLPPVLVSMSEASASILDGDLLLFRRRGLIPIAGRGRHSHAAMAAWWSGDLFCLEVREWYGGRAVTLASQVDRYPGRIDVFEANPGGRWPEFDRAGTVRSMRQFCGCHYGYRAVAATALSHVPLVRLWARPNFEDQSFDARPPFCSEACAMATRLGGGIDPVLLLADDCTEPADLARSPFYRYRFTLLP